MAFLSVEGVAKRVFHNGKGVDVVETVKGRDGSTYERKYTAWFDEPFSYGQGSFGKFSGLFSAKIRDWTDKDGNPVISKQTGKQGQSVETAINSARFELKEQREPVEIPVSWREVDDEMPF
jgi:hypothetical protein